MTDLQRHQTTSSGLTRGRRSSAEPPVAAHVSLNQEQVGTRFGWVEIISPERRYTKGWSHLYVQTKCTGCGAVRWQNFANLKQGKSKGCQACSQPVTVPVWLVKRVQAMKNRCERPTNPGYPNYGGRGIRFDFKSVTEATQWIMDNLGLEKDKELDRINNNGNYAPGNIRYATKSENMRNQRRSKLVASDEEWARTRSPLSIYATRRYLREGFPKEAIIGLAYKAVLDKRKNWRGIRARLTELGYSI